MFCAEILQQIVGLARHYVRTGRTTERRLARLAGVSQPHMHNVLKEIRHLSPESGDKILKALNLTVPDVLWWNPGDPEPGTLSIPIVRDRLGPGSFAKLDVHRGYLVLPQAAVGPLVNPVAARLAPDPAMPLQFRPNDLVVLDRNPAYLEKPPRGWCWVLAEPGGLRVRYLQLNKLGLMSAGEPLPGNAPDWKLLPAELENPTELVRARIVWTSRELEAAPPRSAGPAGGSY